MGFTDQIHRQAAKEYLEKWPYFPRKAENSWKHLKLPYVESDAERLIEKMKGWKFRASEVQALAKTTSQSDLPPETAMAGKSMPSKGDTNWARVQQKVAEIAKDHPYGIKKVDAYREPLVQALMHAIWRKKIPSFATFARNVTNVPGLKTGRPRNK